MHARFRRVGIDPEVNDALEQAGRRVGRLRRPGHAERRFPDVPRRSSHLSRQPVGKSAASAEAPASWWQRLVDVVLASSALVATAPALAVAAAAIKLEDGGSVLFRQRRCGRDQEPFTVLKLRTMAPQASSARHEAYIAELAAVPGRADEDRLHKLTGDPRVTRVGRWLRRLSLDEVPQFLNVIAGDMSVVGPRPALDYELQHYARHHFERFAVRPGLTGLWQVSGRNRLGFIEMLELDVEYARRRSTWLDLRILLRTPAAIGRNNA